MTSRLEMINKITSLIIIIVFSPIYILLSVIIFFDDGLPIFFKQNRIGQNNKIFKLYKFRTMRTNVPDLASHLLNNPDDYFIKNGHWLRKFSFDELPQIFNILKGEMNFIGPRPALYNQNDLIDCRNKLGIQKLKPGITGWAQVNGRDVLTIKQKVELEEFYLNKKSLIMDSKILVLTLKKVIFSDDISH